MEQTFMHNSHEQLSELLNFNIDGLTTEEVRQLSDAQKEVKSIIQDYLDLVAQKKKDKKEITSEILVHGFSDNTEKPGVIPVPASIQSFEKSDNQLEQLELVNVKNGTRITTPLPDGTTVIREVSITPEGLVVLSNTDKNRFGISNEIYMPNEYHMLTEKFRAGIYRHTSDDSLDMTPGQDSSAVGSIPVEPIKNPKEHKSLADLLGVHTERTESINVATEALVSDNTLTPSESIQKPVQVQVPAQVLEQEVKLTNPMLPISLDKIAQQENGLLRLRTHEVAYSFIAQVLTAALRPENIPVVLSEVQTVIAPTLVPEKTSDDQFPLPQVTSQTTKVNPLSMFTSN